MADIYPMPDATDPASLLNPKWKQLVPIADLAEMGGRKAPDRQWALHDWLPLSQATYFTGPGSAGKSLLGQQMATCSALGLPFMGVTMRQANSIYLTCEDDLGELHRRQEAICAALGVTMASLAGKLHLVSLAGHMGAPIRTCSPQQASWREPLQCRPRRLPSYRGAKPAHRRSWSHTNITSTSMFTCTGGRLKLEANPMQRMAMHLSPRCAATTRQRQPCRSPAVKGKRVCRMHGGGRSEAPKGCANGAWKHGCWTNEAVSLRRAASRLLRALKCD